MAGIKTIRASAEFEATGYKYTWAGKMKFSQLDFFTAPVSQIDSPERPFGSLPEGIKKGASVHETKA
ncbi:hypothetical protein DXB08_24785 [Hungatella hathewayi]|nr:hypothetical protein DXB08_24785 [Hungatella hathewayi]